MDWPFVITKVINKQNVEVKIKNRAQIYNVCRLKKFTDPDYSKFKNEESIKKHTVETNDNSDTHNSQNESEVQIKKQNANQVMKNSRAQSDTLNEEINFKRRSVN